MVLTPNRAPTDMAIFFSGLGRVSVGVGHGWVQPIIRPLETPIAMLRIKSNLKTQVEFLIRSWNIVN